jgi:tRNA (adenine57-N1/adenine58-N1)-methyltransferase
LYGLRRQTQIIYPLDSYQIVNLLGLQQGDVVFESGVGSGALALIMLNMGIKLFSFEKRQEFIDLASDNIARWQQFSGQKFDHNILHFDITEDKIEDRFVDFFDK